MFCGHCGAKIKDGSRFCPSCGFAVEEEPQAVQNQATPEMQPAFRQDTYHTYQENRPETPVQRPEQTFMYQGAQSAGQPKTIQQPQPQTVQQLQPAPSRQPQTVQQPQPAQRQATGVPQSQQVPVPPQPPKKKGSAGRIIAFIILFLVAAAISGTLFFIFGLDGLNWGQDNKNSTVEERQDEEDTMPLAACVLRNGEMYEINFVEC